MVDYRPWVDWVSRRIVTEQYSRDQAELPIVQLWDHVQAGVGLLSEDAELSNVCICCSCPAVAGRGRGTGQPMAGGWWR